MNREGFFKKSLQFRDIQEINMKLQISQDSELGGHANWEWMDLVKRHLCIWYEDFLFHYCNIFPFLE